MEQENLFNALTPSRRQVDVLLVQSFVNRPCRKRIKRRMSRYDQLCPDL